MARKLLHRKACLSFVMFIAIEMTAVCPVSLLIDHFEIADLPCGNPVENNTQEEDSCVFCVIAGSMEITDQVYTPPLNVEPGLTALHDEPFVNTRSNLRSIRPPPRHFLK